MKDINRCRQYLRLHVCEREIRAGFCSRKVAKGKIGIWRKDEGGGEGEGRCEASEEASEEASGTEICENTAQDASVTYAPCRSTALCSALSAIHQIKSEIFFADSSASFCASRESLGSNEKLFTVEGEIKHFRSVRPT